MLVPRRFLFPDLLLSIPIRSRRFRFLVKNSGESWRVARPIAFSRTLEGAPSQLCLGGPVLSQTEKSVITY